MIRRSKNRFRDEQNLRLRVLAVLASVSTIIALFGTILGLLRAFGIVDNKPQFELDPNVYRRWFLSEGATYVITIGVATFSYLTYRFKKSQQLYYGLIETAFALVSFYLIFEKIQNALLNTILIGSDIWTALVAGIYLTVRGFSNVSEGWEKDFLFKCNLQMLSIKLFGKQEIQDDE